MSGSTMTSSQLSRRFRIFFVTFVSVVALGTALSFHAGYTRHAYRVRAYQPTNYPTHHVHPTAAQQGATLAVTNFFRREVVTASERFVMASTQLDAAIRAHDVTRAREAELRTQAAFDEVRPSLGIGVTTLTPLDALVSDQSPGIAATGLHAIERQLWAGSLSSSTLAAHNLAQVGPILEIGVFRTILTPSAICGRVDEILSWTVENVIDSSQEQYSHVDMIDARTTLDQANRIIGSLGRLAVLVDRPLAAQLAERSRAVVDVVDAFSATTPNAMVPATTWRELAQRISALEASLGALDGQLNGLGTGRPYA